MEKLVPKVGEDYSVDHGATITNPETGEKVSAKEVIIAELPAIKMGLEAAKALSKNFIVKMAIGIVESAIDALALAFGS